jgi:hypothetical protein
MNRCIPQKGAKTGDLRQAPYSRSDYANSYGGGGGGTVGHSGGGGWLPPGQRLAAAQQEEQKRRFVSAQVLKQSPILVSTKNKGYPDLLLPLNKGNRFRRHAVQVVRRRRLLQYRPLRPLDPADRIDVHFSKTGYQDFFQVRHQILLILTCGFSFKSLLNERFSVLSADCKR